VREAEENLCLLRGLRVEDVAEELKELQEISCLQNNNLGEGRCQATWRNMLQRTTLIPMALLGRPCFLYL
jgi:hypothetical protein